MLLALLLNFGVQKVWHVSPMGAQYLGRSTAESLKMTPYHTTIFALFLKMTPLFYCQGGHWLPFAIFWNEHCLQCMHHLCISHILNLKSIPLFKFEVIATKFRQTNKALQIYQPPADCKTKVL